MKRFTAYRRDISQRETHNALQKNPDAEPQFEGVQWSDGTVTLRWLTPIRAHSVWASLYDALAIHGHPEYGTEIVWHDWNEPPAEWMAQVSAAGGRQMSLVERLREAQEGFQMAREEDGSPDEFALRDVGYNFGHLHEQAADRIELLEGIVRKLLDVFDLELGDKADAVRDKARAALEEK